MDDSYCIDRASALFFSKPGGMSYEIEPSEI